MRGDTVTVTGARIGRIIEGERRLVNIYKRSDLPIPDHRRK